MLPQAVEQHRRVATPWIQGVLADPCAATGDNLGGRRVVPDVPKAIQHDDEVVRAGNGRWHRVVRAADTKTPSLPARLHDHLTHPGLVGRMEPPMAVGSQRRDRAVRRGDCAHTVARKAGTITSSRMFRASSRSARVCAAVIDARKRTWSCGTDG